MLRMTVLRMERGWSKAELGRRARVHPATVGKIENRRHVPYDAELTRIAEALGVKAAEAKRLLEVAA